MAIAVVLCEHKKGVFETAECVVGDKEHGTVRYRVVGDKEHGTVRYRVVRDKEHGTVRYRVVGDKENGTVRYRVVGDKEHGTVRYREVLRHRNVTYPGGVLHASSVIFVSRF
jgi:hypothetical protein